MARFATWLRVEHDADSIVDAQHTGETAGDVLMGLTDVVSVLGRATQLVTPADGCRYYVAVGGVFEDDEGTADPDKAISLATITREELADDPEPVTVVVTLDDSES